MRKAILGAASALALASPAMANGVTPYSEVPSYGGETYAYEYRTPPPIVVEEPAPVVVVRRPVIVQRWLMSIRSMRHRASMRHLLCMRTLVRVGVADGATDVTSAAVGKVSDM